MKAALMIVRITGTLGLVLGLAIWTGNVPGVLVPIHMLLGIVLVVALVVAALLGARAGVGRGLVALAVVWAVVTPLLGLNQAGLLPDAHLVIEVLHLAVGVVAIVLGEAIGAQARSRAAGRPA